MRSIATHLVGVSALLLLAGSALGQNALDRNLQVGSNGIIPTRVDPIKQQIQLNNAIMYGRDTSGKSFRGSLGYAAPDQFGGHLGTDDLYTFRRDTINSAIVGSGVRGSDALRYQFAASEDRVPTFMGQGLGTLARSGAVPTSANATVLRSTSEFLTARAARPALVGVRQDEWGAEFVAKASPLLGVSWMKTRESPLEAGAKTDTNAATGQPRQTATPLSGLESTATGMPSVQDRDQITGLPTRATDQTKAQGTAYLRVMNDVRAETERRQVQPIDQNVNQQPPTVTADATRPVVANTPPEPQTIELQLERLRATMRGEAAPKTMKEVQAKRDADKKAADQLALMQPPKTAPTPAPHSTDLPKQTPKSSEEKTPGERLAALNPDLVKGLRKAGEKKVNALYEAPESTITTIGDPEAYKSMMTSGQHWLSRERYFDAEDRFTRAISAAPGDPMARVGRINAQLGAGLYLSASANLRTLLTDNPELVATRYADNLLPSADRSTKTAEQLRYELEQAGSALQREAALLMAYLGYQRGDDKLTADGLAEFAKRIDADNAKDQALLALIQAAWSK